MAREMAKNSSFKNFTFLELVGTFKFLEVFSFWTQHYSNFLVRSSV